MRTLSKVVLGFAIFAVLVAALAWLIPAEQRETWLAMLPASQGKIAGPETLEPGNEEEGAKDEEAPQRLTLVEGAPAVRLTAAEQSYSGIRTTPLKQVTYRPERRAYGEIVDIGPLLILRARYGAALAQQRIAVARLQVSAQEYERLSGINKLGSFISESRERRAQSRWEVDQARSAAAETRAQDIRAQAVQVWGEALAADTLSAGSERMQRLIARKDVLLRIALPSGMRFTPAARQVFVERNGVRRRAREASLVSPATRTNSASQGETWFFQSAADGLRTGMRVAVWVPQSALPVDGILLPAKAAVWYGGEPWVYVNVDEELFVRRAVSRAQEVAGGWVANEGFEPGEAVVLRGGQMLLSEEFRWQIPEEDDD